MLGRSTDAGTLLQIGANDGVTDDEVHDLVFRYGWRGVLVEPVPYLAQRLARNYAGVPNVAIECVAVADEPGPRPFYRLRAPDPGDTLPPNAEELGSFRREVLLSHKNLIPDIEERVIEDTVQCDTLDAIVARNDLRRIDLLAVDAEGYDAEILRRVPFHTVTPGAILNEHVHLSDADRSASETLLRKHGYALVDTPFDTFALHVNHYRLRGWQLTRAD